MCDLCVKKKILIFQFAEKYRAMHEIESYASFANPPRLSFENVAQPADDERSRGVDTSNDFTILWLKLDEKDFWCEKQSRIGLAARNFKNV